jgi:hypothetical protein
MPRTVQNIALTLTLNSRTGGYFHRLPMDSCMAGLETVDRKWLLPPRDYP